MSHRAFTLIELLVVIAIIGVLAGILLPVYARSQRRAMEATCISNIKQIGAALLMYAQDWDGCAPPYITSTQDRIVLNAEAEKPTVIELAPFNDAAKLKQCFAPYGAGLDELWFCPLDPHDPEDDVIRDPTVTYRVSLIFATRRPVRLDAPPVVSVDTYDRMLENHEFPYYLTWVRSSDPQMPVPYYLACCLRHISGDNRADTTVPHGRRYPVLRLDGSVAFKKADMVVFPSGAGLTGD